MDTQGTIDHAALLHIIVGFILLAGFVLLVFIIYRYRRNQLIKAKEKMEAKFSKTLLESQIEIQEATLNNISQEIHDNIGQMLSLAKLNLFTMDLNDSNTLIQKIEKSKELVSKAITDLRNLSHKFNTGFINTIGLLRAMEQEVTILSNTGVFRSSLEIIGQKKSLGQQKELIVFRMVQELLSNAIKHSEAVNINIRMLFDENELVLWVIDDGKGISPGKLEDTTTMGIGLRNIHERAKLLGGSLIIESTEGCGTIAKISCPFEKL